MIPSAILRLVEAHRALLSPEEAHLIDRALSEARHHLSVAVGIVRRARERGGR